ncbi:MAG TPA: phenylacetate--CoA ligase family protein [Candidatus Kapabacteria bacterium]|nr:phenylacetate--CoA ligase family protein [Candidatus Kapabacteria bacterium]
MRSLLNRFQQLLPDPLVRLGLALYGRIPLGLRYGAAFRIASKLLERSQYWTREQHEEYQLARLQALVLHAYEHVPFYRNLYDSHGVHPSQIVRLEDIRLLPTITKDHLRSHAEAMRATNLPQSKFQYHTTGGSTGIPVGLYWEADRTVPLEKAFIRMIWRWAGFEMERDRLVILRGIPLKNGALYELLPGNQMRVSTYEMTAANLERTIELINGFKPRALHVYPSAAYILAQHINQRGGAGFPSLKVVICASENIYPWQRVAIEKAFGCRVYSFYGQSEYVSLAAECEHTTEYHCVSEYGITEVLDESGKPAAPGRSGEIVGTGFNNNAMPLIRFRTGDRARVSMRDRCECGRSYPLIASVEGRLQEMIVGTEGNLVSMTAINMHNDLFDNVYQFQFYQDTPGEVVFRIVRKSSYTDADEARIRKELEEKLRYGFHLAIEYVDQVAMTPRGKVSFLVQKLPVASFDRAQGEDLA